MARLRLLRRRPVTAVVASAAVLSALAGVPAARAAGAGPGATPAWLAAKRAALAHFQAPPPAQVRLTPAPGGAGYTAHLVSATVEVGPGRASACQVVGELLVPTAASGRHPVPAVVTTNGFGGAYNDGTTLGAAQAAAAFGYVGLTYSGLGFGGSGCQIELDDPQWDGLAASELVSWLGTLPYVTRDGADDPRVGMIGGSYGGSVQFAAASVDPRIDAIVPVITWNDLAYSLAPDNAEAGPVRTDLEPGVEKWEWASLFFADGAVLTPMQDQSLASQAGTGCPDFDPRICQAYVSSLALGYTDRATIDMLRADSMVTYFRRLHLPVMLMQGEQDSLFNITEAVDNYHELQADGDPVSLVLQSWGHSNSSPAPGEYSFQAPFNGYEDILVRDFFSRWLSGTDASTGAAVQYFRPWVSYPAGSTAAPAYGTAPAWPVGTSTPLYLSADGALVGRAGGARAGTVSFADPGGGMGTSYSETSGVQDSAPFSSVPASDAPGTAATFATAPLHAPLDVVGIPSVTFRLASSPVDGVDPATDPVVFAKLYDVAPDGTATLVTDLVSASRLHDTTDPVTVTLPGIVHRFPAGHRLELALAAQDDAYVGGRRPTVYTVELGGGSPGVLDLPVAGNERAGALAAGS